MKSERLMDLISEIDPELIESADIKPTKKKTAVSPVIISLLAAAACVAVIASAGYFIMLAKERSEKHAFDKKGISWNDINSENKNSANDEPENKIDVEIKSVNESGCQLSLKVNNEDDYEKYYTYGDFVLHRKTDDGDILITPNPKINTNINTFAPVIDDSAIDQKNPDKSKKPFTLDQNETEVIINWNTKYGMLDEGDYYITVDIYDSENGTIIQTEIPFTIE
ncbi:MAG: hypothetical protein J6U23_01950 [Clostridiales bacterium]|nr:hypothetical protein [Clostridiales bacterium]